MFVGLGEDSLAAEGSAPSAVRGREQLRRGSDRPEHSVRIDLRTKCGYITSGDPAWRCSVPRSRLPSLTDDNPLAWPLVAAIGLGGAGA